MPASRPADYYLACLGGSVFIDFNQSNKDLIELKRVSFDGYGCFVLENAIPMNQEDSHLFINTYENDNLNQTLMTRLITETIQLNKTQLSIDALKEYDLFS